MFSRVLHVAATVTRIGELKAQLGMAAVKQTGVVTIGYAAASLLALVSVCGALGVCYILLTRVMGPAGALAIISGVGLGVSSLVWLWAYMYSRTKADKKLRAHVAEQEKTLSAMLGLSETDDIASDDEERPMTGSSSSGFGGVDPKVAAAAGLVAVALVGPVRLIRLFRFGIGIVSASALAKRAVREQQADPNGDDAESGPASATTTAKPTPIHRHNPGNGAVPRRSDGEKASSGR